MNRKYLNIICLFSLACANQQPTSMHISSTQQDLVELIKVEPTFVLDIRYATENNFTKQVLYKQARAFLRHSTAKKLVNVQQELKQHGLGLKIFDGYRPHSVQFLMWDVVKKMFNTEDPKVISKYVCEPQRIGRHNRGAAVDVTLVNLADDSELPMPSEFDEFSDKAERWHYLRIFNNTPPEHQHALKFIKAKNAKFLQDVMEKHGFIAMPSEWWHFDDADWRNYDGLDIPFENIK